MLCDGEALVAPEEVPVHRPCALAENRRLDRQQQHAAQRPDAALRPMKKQRREFPTKEEVKSVRFADAQCNHVIEPDRDLTDDELRDRWLQPSDYGAIRENNVLTIIAVKHYDVKISSLDSEKYCIRGLESAICRFLFRGTKEEQHQYQQRTQRNIAKNIVRLHRSQRSHGYDGIDAESAAEELREMSTLLTQQDRDRAQHAATIDASLGN